MFADQANYRLTRGSVAGVLQLSAA
jgi:hypothetical protein